MLDNLRDPDSSQNVQDEDDIEKNIYNPGLVLNTNIKKLGIGRFLDLKSQQLFILLVMLLLAVFLVGAMFLLVTGKIAPSFL